MRNIGLNAQTNVVLTATVTAPGGGAAFSGTYNAGTVNPGDTVTMDEVVTLPGGLAEGIYSMNLTVASNEDAQEDDPADDIAHRSFALSDQKYALDGLGVNPGPPVTSAMGTSTFVNLTDNVFCLNYFPIDEAVDVYGIQVAITASSAEGAMLIASIHDSVPVWDNDDVFNPLVASQDHTLDAAEVAAGVVTLTFDTPYNLQPGAYFAGVELYSNGGATNVSVVDDNTVSQPSAASVINIQGSSPGTYTNGNAFAVRLIMDPTIGFSEVKGPEFSMFPNPTADGLVQVVTASSQRHTYEVTDALGRTLQTGAFTGRTTLDLGAYASGMYTVRVGNATGTTTRLVNRR